MLVANNVTAAQGEDLKVIKGQTQSNFPDERSYEAYEALRKGANIVDKRYKFY